MRDIPFSETLESKLNFDHLNKSILDSIPLSIGIYDNKGYLVYYNKNFEITFGCNSSYIENMKLNIYNNMSTPDYIKDAVRKGERIETCFLYNPKKGIEKDYRKSNRSAIHIKCSGNPILDSTGKQEYYMFNMKDITEEIKSEELLRSNRYKMDMAMRVADIALLEFDVSSLTFHSDNDPLNGYDSSKPISMDQYLNVVHPDDIKNASATVKSVCNGEDISFNVEVRMRLEESGEWQYCSIVGAPYEYDDNGNVTKYIGARKNNTLLQKKKMLQEKILNSIPISIHIKDVEDNFKYIFCNDESRKMFGTSEEKATQDIMSLEDAECIHKTDIEVFKTGEPYFGIERINLKNGCSYETLVNKSVIEDEGKRLLLNIRWDQSLQNELKRNAKVLSLTLETMRAFTWFYEPDKDRLSLGDDYGKVGGSILDVNTAEKYTSFIHPDDAEHFAASLKEFSDRNDGIWEIDYRFDITGKGDYQWWETRGIIDKSVLNDSLQRYMFGMTICIDAHKKTEIALLENKERLDKVVVQNDQILNNTSSGLAYIGIDHIVQWENISVCSESLSYEAYKTGELCYKSAHNRTEPCEDCVLQRAIKSKETEKITFCLLDNNIVEVFATPVILDDGTVEGVVIRLDDITERENIIKELREAKKLAEKSDKLKSAFLANMSHEIRTPLNAIVGFSELLMSCENDERQEYIRIINTNNELLLKLINDILDLSKIEAGSMEFMYETFDLSEYFDGLAISMKRRVTNPKVTFKSINPYKKCLVKLDYNRVAQILTNYTTNAIKYTPAGFIEMGYVYRDNGIYIFVKDSGIGIPDEKKDRVFHRFEKLDDFAQGTGLGLSICKAIAEAMNGYIGFDSIKDQGSTFWAFLPCKAEIETLDEIVYGNENIILNDTIPIKIKRDMENIRTILVAEDILSNYMLLEAMLKKEYKLIHATNGQEAINRVKEGGIDLVLMDMKMPIMNGLIATAEIRKFDNKIIIVALTAHAFESDRIDALEAGCNEYLVKPINKDNLINTLNKYCK